MNAPVEPARRLHPEEAQVPISSARVQTISALSEAGPSLPLDWERTPDGITVLRFSPYWRPGWPAARVARLLAGPSPGGTPVRLVIDLRQSRGTEPSYVLRSFLALFPAPARQLPHRRAYLLDRDHQERLVEMLQMLTAPPRIEAGVFRSWDDALDWLRTSA